MAEKKTKKEKISVAITGNEMGTAAARTGVTRNVTLASQSIDGENQEVPTLASLSPSAERTAEPKISLDRNQLPESVIKMIQDRAYEIWQEENCPHGRDADHWAQAERETLANTRALRELLARS